MILNHSQHWLRSSRSFKVIKIGTSGAHMRLPISLPLYSYLPSFPSDIDLLVENLRFFSPFLTHPSVAHPSVVWSPRKGVALGPMLWKLVQKTRPWATRWWKPRDSTVISFVSKTQYQCATEGRTDGQICMSMPKSNSVHGWALQKCSASELLSTPNFWHLPNDFAQFLCGSWASC